MNSSFSTLCYTTQKHVGYQLAPARHRFLERQALGSATGRVKHFCVYYGTFFMMISNRFTDPKPRQTHRGHHWEALRKEQPYQGCSSRWTVIRRGNLAHVLKRTLGAPLAPADMCFARLS